MEIATLMASKKLKPPAGKPEPKWWSAEAFGEEWEAAKLRDTTLTAQKLGELSGVQSPMIYSYRNGTHKPGVNVALALARALGVPFESLLR